MSLAPDSITVKDEASGVEHATKVVGGKHHPVVILADQAGHMLDSLDTWYAWANNVAFANNKQMFSIFNETGSGKVVKIRKVFIVNLQTGAITGVAYRLDFKKISTHAPGTPITAEAADSNNAALPSGIEISTGGTVTEGNLLWSQVHSNEEMAANTSQLIASVLAALTNWVPEGRNIQELTLREGQGLTIKCVTSTTVGSLGVLCVFTVE